MFLRRFYVKRHQASPKALNALALVARSRSKRTSKRHHIVSTHKSEGIIILNQRITLYSNNTNNNHESIIEEESKQQ